jgi:hypothetical protein
MDQELSVCSWTFGIYGGECLLRDLTGETKSRRHQTHGGENSVPENFISHSRNVKFFVQHVQYLGHWLGKMFKVLKRLEERDLEGECVSKSQRDITIRNTLDFIPEK